MPQPPKNVAAYANDIDFTLRSNQASGAKIADLLVLHEKTPDDDRYLFVTALIAALVFGHEADVLNGSAS